MKKIFSLIFISVALMLSACSTDDVLKIYVSSAKSELPQKIDDTMNWKDISLTETAMVLTYEVLGEFSENAETILGASAQAILVNLKQMQASDEDTKNMIKQLKETNRGITMQFVDLNKKSFEVKFTKDDL
jgi:hypothetical protein